MTPPTPEADPAQLLAAALELPEPQPTALVPPLAGTSLDTSSARLLSRLAPPAAVERILAGPGPVPRPAGPAAGLAAEWQRELRELRRRHGGTDRDLAAALRVRGHDVRSGALPALYGAGAPTPDRDLAADLVTLLGGDWEGGGYADLYAVARAGLSGAVGGDRVRARSMHGLTGIEPVDAARLRARLRPPVPAVPVHGRELLVRGLVASLTRPGAAPQVITGRSGVGKSTVAQVVAQRVADSAVPLAVLWAPAHDEDELVTALFSAAAGLGATLHDLRAATRAHDRVERLWRLLDRSGRRWLLVLDDAEPGAAAGGRWARPSPAGTVLVTTRTPDGWEPAEVTPVTGLDPATGARVLLDRVVAGGQEARASLAPRMQELSRRLGGIPLALRAMGTFLGSGLARPGVDDLLDPAAEGGLRDAVDIPLRGLARSGVVGARDALRLLAAFAPGEPLPASLLRSPAVPSRLAAVDHLVRAGLVESAVLDGGRYLRVHPAVAEQSRTDRRVTVGAHATVRLAVALLHEEAGRFDAGTPAQWPALRRLEPHAEELLETVPVDDPGAVAAVVRMVRGVATGLTRAGNHAGATTLLRRSLVLSAVLGDTHRERLALRRDLAWLAGLRGDLQQAVDDLRALLAVHVRLYGYGGPEALTTRSRLAWALAEQGDLARAEYRHRQLLPAFVAMCGDQHPDTLSIRHRIGWITALRGRHGEAVTLLEQVLAARLAVLGTDHTDVFSTRYRLAWALAHRDLLEDAAQQFVALQADLEQVLGVDHPMTLMVRFRVAWVQAFHNDYDDAERGYADLLADQEKVLGAEHPRTLRTRHMLAALLLHRGRFAEAEEALRSLVHDREVLLGPDHHDTFDVRFDHALSVARGGRADEAEQLLRALLLDRRRALGRTAPRTLMTAVRLARVLVRRGQLDEADALLADLVTEAGPQLEPDGSLGFDVRHTQAFISGLRGRLRTSEEQFRALLADRLAALGPDDRETLASRDYLCWVLGVAGRTAEAERHCRTVLDGRRRVFGDDHPTTALSRYRLAWLRAAGGHHHDAELLFTSNLAEAVARGGADSRDALRNRGGLAWVLRRTGRLVEAESAARRLVNDRLRVQGPDDVHTLRARDALGLVLVARGRCAEAQQLLTELLVDLDALLGEDHRDTLLAREHLAGALDLLGRSAEAAVLRGQVAAARRRAIDDDDDHQ